MSEPDKVIRDALATIQGFLAEGVGAITVVQVTMVDDALAALDALLTEREELREAIRVYTSKLHLCGARQCSCGAYSSLRSVLSGTSAMGEER